MKKVMPIDLKQLDTFSISMTTYVNHLAYDDDIDDELAITFKFFWYDEICLYVFVLPVRNIHYRKRMRYDARNVIYLRRNWLLTKM